MKAADTSRRWLFFFFVFLGIFLAVALLMNRWWGLSRDSALAGGFAVALIWFAWRAVLERLEVIQEELRSLYLCLYDPRELERRRQKSKLASFVRRGIQDKEITKGMNLHEIEGLLRTRKATLDSSTMLVEALKKGEKQIVFYEYFCRFPTPSVVLRFKDGKLADWQFRGYASSER